MHPRLNYKTLTEQSIMKTKILTLICLVLVYVPLISKSQYYNDLKSNIPQAPSVLSSVSDIQSAFNNGRTKENQQLGTSLPQITLPGNWTTLNIQQRAAWILNKERVDRGLISFAGSEANVISVAQNYADYLLKNDKFGHTADGLNPQTRLNNNTTIGKCNEQIYSNENLYVTVSSSTADIPYELEYGIYAWLYNDAGSAWGHRRCLLQTAFKDNSGVTAEEGLFGIGVASGGPYKGDFSQTWAHAEIVVFNVIDPCASWIYTDIHETDKYDYNIYYNGSKIVINTPLLVSADIEVYTVLGEIAYKKRLNQMQGDILLENSFTPGIYLVRITSGNNFSGARKIVVN